MTELIITTKEELQKIVNEAVQRALTGTKDDSELLLESSEVMEMCKISHTTLQKWRDKDLIKFTKVLNKILYKKSDIIKMMENKKIQF